MPYETLNDGLRDAGFTLPAPFTEDGTAVNHDALARTSSFSATRVRASSFPVATRTGILLLER